MFLSLEESLCDILWIQGRHKSTAGYPGTVLDSYLCQFWSGRLISPSSLLDLTEPACFLGTTWASLNGAPAPKHLSSPTGTSTWALMMLSWPWGCPQHPTPCHPQPHTRGGVVSELIPCRLGSDPWGSLGLVPWVDLCCLQTHADPGRCPEVFGRAAFWLISPSGLSWVSLAGITCTLGKTGLSHSFPLSTELGRAGKSSSSPQTTMEHSSRATKPCPQGHCFPGHELST